MAVTIAVNGPPVLVTLATTCALLTTDGTTVAEGDALYLSSDEADSSAVVRVVSSDTLADGGALGSEVYHEITTDRLPTIVPLHNRRVLLQGSSAFQVSASLLRG